ncbi:MAG: arsenate reductase (glutaredoxin) [Acidiferrobacterales bacterium]|jgi:arsenate reductase|nr:arsenate reductase (glutaredoxin) [Acidiferrobacterales bacterium]
MTVELQLYHNPRCSKSRQALALLQERGYAPEIIEYLKTPPDVETLKKLLGYLRLKPRDILRKKEKEYLELGLDNGSLTDEQILQAIVKAPKLLERPILVRGERAAIGRPTENLLPLLD